MGFDIDFILSYVVFPLLRFPVPIAFACSKLYAIVVFSIWTLIINGFYWLELWFRSRGEQTWKSLNELHDPIVLITGGSNGLGRCIIHKLLRSYNNIKVINLDLDVQYWSEEARVINIECDLVNADGLELALKKIKSEYEDKINLLICNAGVRSRFNWFEDTPIDEMQRIMNINTWSTARILQAIIPRDNQRQLYIVTISSVLGILAPSKVASYAASKAAITALHNSMTNDFLVRGIGNIRTLLVLPGQIDTQMFDGFPPPRKFWAPIVCPAALAEAIIDHCENGLRGTLRTPLYSYFPEFLMGIPYLLQRFARNFSKMDNCLPIETISSKRSLASVDL
ncbi:short chain dehydrogenase [Nakaseomyces glabratus]|nr:short chain dehydrogenase [Nakaseomyces glabratus]